MSTNIAKNNPMIMGSLEKNIFDMAVWSKLSSADKVFLLQIIYAMPNALKQLEKQKTAIHRSYTTTTALNLLPFLHRWRLAKRLETVLSPCAQ